MKSSTSTSSSSSIAVKISKALADAARVAAADADRSLTGQVEHWARLGKAIEPGLSSATVAILKQFGSAPSPQDDQAERARVLETLALVSESPPYTATRAALAALNTPLYESNPDDPSTIIQVTPDGQRTPGRFVDRVFVPAT